MNETRRALLKQLRALGYQVALREDNRFFDIYQEQNNGQAGSTRSNTLHRLSFPEAQQLAKQPAHPVKLEDYTYGVGAVRLYLFPDPAVHVPLRLNSNREKVS